MNKNSISKTHAARIVKFIKMNACCTSANICDSIGLTKYQFQSALPYVKNVCKRVKLEWYLK